MNKSSPKEGMKQKPQRPKSGISRAIVAEIGYLSISVTATPPGRHLIDQRGPPLDDGHIFARYTQFGLFNEKKGTINDYPATLGEGVPKFRKEFGQNVSSHHTNSSIVAGV